MTGGGFEGRRFGYGRRRGRRIATAFAAVVAGQGDTPGDEGDAAKDGERGGAGRGIGVQGIGSGDFFGKNVLRHGGDGVVKKAAVFLQADECARLSLAEVVFDDKVGTLVTVEGDEQVVADAVGNDALRADAGGKVGDLVVNAVNSLDVLGGARGFDVVLANGVAGSVLQGKVELCHVVAFLFFRVFLGDIAILTKFCTRRAAEDSTFLLRQGGATPYRAL